MWSLYINEYNIIQFNCAVDLWWVVDAYKWAVMTSGNGSRISETTISIPINDQSYDYDHIR